MADKTKEATAVQESSACPTVKKKGWGIENLPYPKGVALIQARWDLCTGCGTCEVACSMRHFGVFNR